MSWISRDLFLLFNNVDIEQNCEVGRVCLWDPASHFLYFTFSFWHVYSQKPSTFSLSPTAHRPASRPPPRPPHFLSPVSYKMRSQALLRINVLTYPGWRAFYWESEPLSSSSPKQASPAVELQASVCQRGRILWVCRFPNLLSSSPHPRPASPLPPPATAQVSTHMMRLLMALKLSQWGHIFLFSRIWVLLYRWGVSL